MTSDRISWTPLLLLCLGGILFVFGGAGILERLWFAPEHPEWVPLLHAVRGIASSLLAAGLVVGYLRKKRLALFTPPDLVSGRDVGPEGLEHLVGSARWLIGLRWFAVTGVAAAVGGSSFLLGEESGLHYPALFVGIAGMAAVNAAYRTVLPRCPRVDFHLGMQFLGDAFFAVYFLHFAGGMTNPFVPIALLPVVLAALLLSRPAAYGVGCVAVGLLAGMGIGESSGLLAYHPILSGGSDGGAVGNLFLLAGHLVAFAIAAFVLVHLTGSVRTQLRTSERARLRLVERSQREKRLALLGELTAGTAHEIRNPLAAAMNAISRLAKDSTIPPSARGSVELIGRALDRIGGVTDRLLTLSRQRRVGREAVDLAAACDRSLEMLRHRWEGNGIEISRCFAEKVPAVAGDRYALEEVVTNLVTNALDAVGSAGRIVVEVRRCRCAGGAVELLVEDDGEGIPPDRMERIFAPFYTTKPIGKGCGLGLPICRRIVEEEHGGRIEIRGEPGRGTRCLVCLPASAVSGVR